MTSLCIFCGANKGIHPEIIELSKNVAKTMASRDITLVYGAGKVGIMGVLANEILEQGGKAIGVIPDFLKKWEVCHENLTELHVTETMHQRKEKMARISDGFLVLPGGFGTLDEFFEILTWKQLHLHQKPIALLNWNGYYDALIDHMDNMIAAGFLRKENRALVMIDTNFDLLLERMMHYEPTPVIEKWLEKS